VVPPGRSCLAMVCFTRGVTTSAGPEGRSAPDIDNPGTAERSYIQTAGEPDTHEVGVLVLAGVEVSDG